MAVKTISLLTAVTALNLTDAAVFPVDDANGNTRKATIAQVRTQLASGIQTFTDTTDASSATVGAAKFAGGIAVAKKIYTGTGLVVVAGGITVTAGTSALQAITGTSLTVSGTSAQTGGGTSNGVGTSVTTGDVNTLWIVRSGTNAGANNNYGAVHYMRGSTALWTVGVLGTVATDGAMRWYDETTSATKMTLALSTGLLTVPALSVSGTSALGVVTATPTVTVGLSFASVMGGALTGTTPIASFGANYYNNGSARVRPDTGKEGLMWEMDAGDSVYLQHITSGGVATAPARITTAGALTLLGGISATTGTFTGNLTRSDAAEFSLVAQTGQIISLRPGGGASFSADESSTAGDIRINVYDVTGGGMVRVSRGAADSGGSGYRVLRIPN